MKSSIARIKGAGFILWQSRHVLYHILLGMVFSWILRELWKEFNWKWILLAAIASLSPDIEHFYYFFGYGKKESYTQELVRLVRERKWRMLAYTISHGHKNNTQLIYHNIYTVLVFLGLSLTSFLYDFKIGIIIFGSISIHYIFDIFDDYMILGYLNPNWKRWGKSKLSLTLIF
jgi:hypothetical protein